jgi:hypothetical protein
MELILRPKKDNDGTLRAYHVQQGQYTLAWESCLLTVQQVGSYRFVSYTTEQKKASTLDLQGFDFLNMAFMWLTSVSASIILSLILLLCLIQRICYHRRSDKALAVFHRRNKLVGYCL